MAQNWFQVIFLVMLIGYVRAQFTKKQGDSTSSPTSNISKQKCREYSQYRTLGSVSTILRDGELYDVDDLSQFPHMALLGFDTDNGVDSACSGTIISENFILTAAHCLNNRHNFPVSRVQVGFLDKRNRDVFGALQEFRVRNVFVHPERTPPQTYHDIALLQLDKPVRFSNVTFPACLYNEPEVRVPKGIVTGWGFAEIGNGEEADILQKVSLPFISKEQCEEELSHIRRIRFPRGIDSASQFCAGTDRRNLCLVNFMGPIQIHDSTGMINIVGITTSGNMCGVSPGVYTRVSHYVPWIENIVWS